MKSRDAEVEPCFTSFQNEINKIELPKKFTFPFYYEPHQLSILASEKVQEYLISRTDWIQEFGVDKNGEGRGLGKMFGVLVVQKKDGEIGYLKAFSGKIGDSNHHKSFVPPVFDLLHKEGKFRKGEEEISDITKEIDELERTTLFKELKTELNALRAESEESLKTFREEMKLAKKKRKSIRNEAEQSMNESDFENLKEKLKNESLKYQYDYKQLSKSWNEKLLTIQEKFDSYVQDIDKLKEDRKNRSSALQKWIFDQYQFLNAKEEPKAMEAIFEQALGIVPPSGAGECAAPKLLQYAFKNKLKPIAMTEFWWGKSPSSEVRKHKHFYPSCKSKCEPILGHMLKGLDVDENPMLLDPGVGKEIEIIYEDEVMLAVNKPAEFLSVPGKQTEDSVYSRIRDLYPTATGPLIVHRLDMSTSGIMLLAKNKDAHKFLQKQFLQRSIQKRYIALLDGIINESEGIIELPLRVDLEDRPRQLVCYEYGKPAKTKYKVLERFEGKTRIQFFPITGRTHQLRVHSAHEKGLNTPIVGDDLYGKKTNRLHLHAEFIEFLHPVSRKKIQLSVPPEF